MFKTDLSLHFATIHSLNVGGFDAVEPNNTDEIAFAAVDIEMPGEELGRRLFHCAQWNSRGRIQLQSTLGLAQLIKDNPTYLDYAQTKLPKYYATMEEMSDNEEAVQQVRELLIEDAKEIANDTKVIAMETMVEPGAIPRNIGTYWKWEMGWGIYKSLDKVQDALSLKGTFRNRYPLPTISIPTPSTPDFRTVALTALPPENKKVAAVIKIWFGTNREYMPTPNRPGETFGNRRDPEPGVKVHYGLARVSIPKRHDEGKIERPWWNWELFEDEALHFVLKQVQMLDEKVWIAGASAQDADGLVFVHGFNVSFEDAMYRSAQLAHDLKYEGPVFCFSWASRAGAKPFDYTADEATIDWSEDHLAIFLQVITEKLGLKRLHIIAHSMGNRAVLGVLAKWAKVQGAAQLSQVVLAAPDVDSPTFLNHSTDLSKCERATLYVSRADWAIHFSRGVHKSPRVGDGDPVVIVAGVDTVDATIAGDDVLGLGHSYFAAKSKIFGDLFYVITQQAIPAGKRVFLHPIVPPGYFELT